MRLWNSPAKDPGRIFQLQAVSCAAKLTEHRALAFHVRQVQPFSTPSLQPAPHFSSTGQSVLQEHQATGKEQQCVVAQNSLFKQAGALDLVTQVHGTTEAGRDLTKRPVRSPAHSRASSNSENPQGCHTPPTSAICCHSQLWQECTPSPPPGHW